MLYVFIGCLTFGVIYSAISALLGGAHGLGHGGFDHGGISHGGFDHAGAAVDHAGAGSANAGVEHAGTGHAAGAHGHTASDTNEMPSPLNPLVIASAITAFGAAGLITKAGLGMGDLMSSLIALCSAGAIGALMFFGIVRLVYASQSNSVFSQEDLIGAEAEVITPIPAKGMGEIAYVINGVRYNLSASSRDGGIPRGNTVIIREIGGNSAIVQKKITLDEIELPETEVQKVKDNEQN